VFFRPFGLDIPDELAAVCTGVKEALTAEQTVLEQAQDRVFAKPAVSANTAVGKILSSLTAKADFTPLRALATLTDGAQSRLQRLNEDLAGNPLLASAEQKVWAEVLTRLADDLAAVLAGVADAPISNLRALAEDARDKRAAATLAAERAFGGAALPGVGEPAWRALWSAARRYSEKIAYPKQRFPMSGVDALCLLCHQPLSEDAGKRMIAFETFVKAETEQQAQHAEKTFDDDYKAFLAKPIHLTAFPARRQLAVSNPELAAAVLRTLAVCRLRRRYCLKAIEDGADVEIPELPSTPATTPLCR
jgi:hypothetical protein